MPVHARIDVDKPTDASTLHRSEVVSLLPVLIVLYVGAPSDGMRAPAWNATLLFGGQTLLVTSQHANSRVNAGMMLSRIGLWAFDLCQLKELQLALATHPRRNSLYVRIGLPTTSVLTDYEFNRTALQYSMQNIADMLKVSSF